MRREILIGAASMLLLGAVLFAQAPAGGQTAGTPGTRVAVVDFQRAVFENSDGKKAQEKLQAELTKRESEFVAKQKQMTEIQNKLQTQEKVLSDAVKADMAKQIDRMNVDLQRLNDDAQKDIGDLQQQLLRPIADRTQRVLQSYSSENGFAVVFDLSSQANSIVYHQDLADITTEIIRRVDADIAKSPAAEATKKPAAPAADPAKKAADPATKK